MEKRIVTPVPPAPVEPAIGKRPNAVGPALALFVTAPLVAEYLLGNLPLKLLGAMVLLAPLYGGGALLVREVARRTGRGWPCILLLGMAYGVFEEAYGTQSLFNPDYLRLHLGLLKPAYLPVLGIGAWWTLWMLMVHGIWSISAPIALIEGCFPRLAKKPWLGGVGLALTVVAFGAGAMGLGWLQRKPDPFRASLAQFAGAGVAMALLVVGAFAWKGGTEDGRAGKAPPAWQVGTLAWAAGMVALLVPNAWGCGAVAALLALDALALGAVLWWSGRCGWGLRHRLALGAGAALAYGVHAFAQAPAVGPADASARIGNGLFLAATLVLIATAARRVRAFEATGEDLKDAAP